MSLKTASSNLSALGFFFNLPLLIRFVFPTVKENIFSLSLFSSCITKYRCIHLIAFLSVHQGLNVTRKKSLQTKLWNRFATKKTNRVFSGKSCLTRNCCTRKLFSFNLLGTLFWFSVPFISNVSKMKHGNGTFLIVFFV